jgi:hypothetical protein
MLTQLTRIQKIGLPDPNFFMLLYYSLSFSNSLQTVQAMPRPQLLPFICLHPHHFAIWYYVTLVSALNHVLISSIRFYSTLWDHWVLLRLGSPYERWTAARPAIYIEYWSYEKLVLWYASGLCSHLSWLRLLSLYCSYSSKDWMTLP